MPLIPKEENREATITLVRQFKEDGLCEKYKFMFECSGNVIVKYPTFTFEEMQEWNKEYYSPTRQALRINPHWLTKEGKIRKQWSEMSASLSHTEKTKK